MRQTTVRWIAIAIVGAMIAAIGVGVISGGGDTAGSNGDDDGGQADSAGASEPSVADGPHVELQLCSGATCPEPDEAAQQALLAELDADARVASSRLLPSDQVYQLFLDELGDQQDLVESIDPELVPALVHLELYDPEGATEVATSYEEHEAVANARDVRATAP